MTVLERDRAIAHAWRTGDVKGYLRLTGGKGSTVKLSGPVKAGIERRAGRAKGFTVAKRGIVFGRKKS